MLRQRLTCVLAVAAAFAACSTNDVSDNRAGGGIGGQAGGSSSGGAGGATSTSTRAFTPAQSASIVVALELAEIDEANVALRRTTSSSVRTFAQEMVTVHTASVQRLQALQGIGTVSSTDTTAALLAREVERTAQALQTEPATTFDLAFMTAQMGVHSQLLGLLDNVLIPSVAGQVDGGSSSATDAGTTRDAGTAVTDAGDQSGFLDAALNVMDLTTTSTVFTELVSARSDAIGHLNAALALQTTLR